MAYKKEKSTGEDSGKADADDLDMAGNDKDHKLDADDDLDKDSRFYGRKDCIKL